MRSGTNGARRIDLATVGVGLCVGLLLGWPLAVATGVGASTRNGALSSGGSLQEVRRIAAEVTVRISGEGCLGTTMGTGVRVGPGEVLTAAHVVAGESVAAVVDDDGTAGRGADITKLGAVDAATLHTTSSGRWVHRREGRARIGETVVVAGSPGGGEVLVRTANVVGEVSGRVPGDPLTSLLLDVEAQPGDSGGPVLDLDGRLIGIVYARSNADGRALVIPLDGVVFGAGRAGVACR